MSPCVLKGIANVSSISGVTNLFYVFNSKFKRILTFHNVLPDGLFEQNVANGVSCSASTFRKTIKMLSERWNFSTDLCDPRTITITFDDGYLNQYEIAAEILKEEGDIPAYIFPAGDVLDGKMLVVDQLLHWASYVPSEILREKGYANGTELWVKEIWPRFNEDAQRLGMGVWQELNSVYPFEKIFIGLSSEYNRLRLSGISQQQLKELRERGWKVGWHTQSHYPLSRLSIVEKRREMTPPVDMQGEVFSFPYGETASVDLEAVQLAEELGFPAAVSNTTVRSPLTGRYFLPRMSASSDKYLHDFELSGLKHFLKFRRLLPTFE